MLFENVEAGDLDGVTALLRVCRWWIVARVLDLTFHSLAEHTYLCLPNLWSSVVRTVLSHQATSL